MEQREDAVLLKTRALGVVMIQKEFIEKIVADDGVLAQAPKEPVAFDQKPAEKPWKKEFSFGYSLAQGNTEKQRIAGRLFFNRKTKENEVIIKGEHLYASTDKKMDTQRFNGILHYAFHFAQSLRWYNFYRLEGDHDRFAKIDYRLTPFTGVGYWFFSEERLKVMVEIGVGYEYTNYTDEQESIKKNIFTPQIFFEKGLWGKSRVSQRASLYLPPENVHDYRIRLETAFTNPMDRYWALRLTLIDDFNNFPGENVKKNDLRLISSLVYSF